MPGADLALTFSTIADAREVFEIVIEMQLVVLYAMKIYCKTIVNTSMSEIWAYFGASLWFPLRTEAAVSGELGPVDNSTQ